MLVGLDEGLLRDVLGPGPISHHAVDVAKDTAYCCSCNDLAALNVTRWCCGMGFRRFIIPENKEGRKDTGKISPLSTGNVVYSGSTHPEGWICGA
jgi:hypothetical protein